MLNKNKNQVIFVMKRNNKYKNIKYKPIFTFENQYQREKVYEDS